MFSITAIQSFSCPELEGKSPETVFAPFSEQNGSVLLLSGGTNDGVSIIGLYPAAVIHDRTGEPVMETKDGTAKIPDPFDLIDEIANRIPPKTQSSPPGIAFGYISYDYRTRIEQLPDDNTGKRDLPDVCFVLPSHILIYHHSSSTWERFEISYTDTAPQTWEEVYSLMINAAEIPFPQINSEKLSSSFNLEEHCKAVETTKNYIINGDIYQANISREFSLPIKGNSYPLFLEIYRSNPAPYFAYLSFRDHTILSSSPELLLEIKDGNVLSEPIKGTAPRDNDPSKDRRSKEELLQSEKDAAELSMIVDLIRNDLGKVCTPGSVKVGTHREVRGYSNVFHTHSEVVGELTPEASIRDIVHAVFPGGSITGCPKIRSMEIIDEIETQRRHIYTGSIGYFGPNRAMKLNIAIRTALVHQDTLYFSVGGGIVYDSDGLNEYEETTHKAETWLRVFRNKS